MTGVGENTILCVIVFIHNTDIKLTMYTSRDYNYVRRHDKINLQAWIFLSRIFSQKRIVIFYRENHLSNVEFSYT